MVYIGQTVASLKQRRAQFEGSAFEGKDGHAGGWNYYEGVGAWRRLLWASAMPVPEDMPEHLIGPFDCLAERKLLLDSAPRWERLPTCNRRQEQSDATMGQGADGRNLTLTPKCARDAEEIQFGERI